MMSSTLVAAFVTLSRIWSITCTEDLSFTENVSQVDEHRQEDDQQVQINTKIVDHIPEHYGESLYEDNCSVGLSNYYKEITNIQEVIMKTLDQMLTTAESLQETDERRNWVLIEMCAMEILSNRFDKAVRIFDLIFEELAISRIVKLLYIDGDLECFEQIISFINLLQSNHTKINGLTKLYGILIENKDLNIVNSIMMLHSVRLVGIDESKYMRNVLTKQISKFVEQKEIDLFFTFARQFDKLQLTMDLIPTFVSFVYDKKSENIQHVLDRMNDFYYLDLKFNVIIALSKQIVEHKHNDENQALAVVYNIIHYETIIAKDKLLDNHGQLLKRVENSLPHNFLPLLYTELCLQNKHYNRYLLVDSDDNVRQNKYRPMLTRKTLNPSLMYMCSMKFAIRFKCVQANCNTVAIESMMNQQAELLFAENGTVHTYKGQFPANMELQGKWILESDGEYFQLKNGEYGTFLQMDKIIDENKYELNLKDVSWNRNSDKAKWKIEKCQHQENYNYF